MKRIYFILFFISLIGYSNAQLQNLDFEEWDAPTMEILHNPTNWVSHNGMMALPYLGFIHPPQTDAQNNDYALKLGVYYNYAKNAAVQTASIDYRLGQLKGFYKYEDNNMSGPDGMISDTAMVVVHLTKYNTSTLQRDTIGMGSVNLHHSDNYAGFEVNIAYINNDVPDSVHVLLDPSLANRYYGRYYVSPQQPEASFFTVDNLSLEAEQSVGIEEAAYANNMSIYINPAQNSLRITLQEKKTVSIYNAAGMLVQTIAPNIIHNVDTNHYSSGMYIVKSGNDVVRFIKQ
jgi:hypothetical protein